MKANEVIKRFCELQAEVSEKAIGYQYASDCFCGQSGFGSHHVHSDSYRNDGMSLEFIEKATRDALAAQPAADTIAKPQDSLASNQQLLPCPFCGASAAFFDTEEGENAGGKWIQCTDCGVSSMIRFPLKEGVHDMLIEAWNRRVAVPETPSTQIDYRNELRILLDSLTEDYEAPAEAVARANAAWRGEVKTGDVG